MPKAGNRKLTRPGVAGLDSLPRKGPVTLPLCAGLRSCACHTRRRGCAGEKHYYSCLRCVDSTPPIIYACIPSTRRPLLAALSVFRSFEVPSVCVPELLDSRVARDFVSFCLLCDTNRKEIVVEQPRQGLNRPPRAFAWQHLGCAPTCGTPSNIYIYI